MASPADSLTFYVANAGVVEEYVSSDSDDDSLYSGGAKSQVSPFDRVSSRDPTYVKIGKAEAEALAEAAAVPHGGMKWHAKLFPDNFANPKHVTAAGELKPRRPLPQARVTELLGCLVKTDAGRFFFGGRLNGWPALSQLELRAITTLPRERRLRFQARVARYFDADTRQGKVPETAEEIAEFAAKVVSKCSVRLRFQSPPWSARGYEEGCPGRVFWWDGYPSAKGAQPRVVIGDRMVKAAEAGDNPMATAVHLFGHRYAKQSENIKDRLTYHSAVLIEWEPTADGQPRHCSVVELAWLNGLGGYGGKSNFVPDRDSPRPALYAAMPDSMKAPWITSLSEIRVVDVPAQSREDFAGFLKEHTGRDKRFLEPLFTASSVVRLRHRRQADLFAHLLNYVRANPTYAEESRNCQTFAADLYRHLTGNYSVEPFSAVCRPLYVCRAHTFLYEDIVGVLPDTGTAVRKGISGCISIVDE